MFLAYLSDDTIVLSSVATGNSLLSFKFDKSMIGEDDRIVDIQPTYSSKDPFFVLMSEQGKIIIYHYETVDSGVTYRKYIRHLADQQAEHLEQICYSRTDETMLLDLRQVNLNKIGDKQFLDSLYRFENDVVSTCDLVLSLNKTEAVAAFKQSMPKTNFIGLTLLEKIDLV